MSLRVHGHPLSSYCWKVFVALDEARLPYELAFVDLADPAAADRLRGISPFVMMPALEDGTHGVATSEATVIIQHLARAYPSAADLVPQGDPGPAGPRRFVEPGVPMGRADVLKPADIDHIVHMAVGVDMVGPDLQRDDEDLTILARRQGGTRHQASPAPPSRATPFSAIRA